MGEAKNKEKIIEEAVQKLTLGALQSGHVVMAGFAAFLKVTGLVDEPFEEQERAFSAYMAGADHVFSTLLNVMSEGGEVDPEDERRVGLMFEEMVELRKILEIKFAARGMASSA